MEIWKEVAGYEGIYEISNLGRVRRRFIQYLKGRTVGRGEIKYRKVELRKDGEGKEHAIHRLVAKAFIPGDHKLVVNHKNGVRNDNRVENLEWLTNTENMRHAWRTGLMSAKYGEASSNAKLKNENVREIRRRFSAGETAKVLAKEFGVTVHTIWDINSGRRWGHLS